MENLNLQQLGWLFFALLGLIFAVLVLLIVYVVVANRRQRARMFEAYEVDKLPPRPILQVTGQVLSLVRDEGEAGLKVEVEGAKYRRLADIEDPQIRRQVVDAAFELIRFTGVLDEGAVAPASVEKTGSWREDLRVSSQDELSQIRSAPRGTESSAPTPPAPEKVEERFLSLLAEMGQAPSAPERPSVMSSIQQRLAPKPLTPERSRTFVDDIEDIIQRRVRLVPALAGRDLHVRLDAAGSVRFAFQGREYENLDELPNMTARQLIRDAIQEWEETT
jgi:hypothetical protein